MTRQEAARIITIILDCCKGKEEDYEEHEIIPLEESFKALGMAIEALAEPNWIPVSERLPEIEGKYLVTFCAYEKEIKGETVVIGDKNKSVAEVGFGCSQKDFLGYPIGFGWYDLGTADYYDQESIVAWMPLPEIYREDGEKE